MSEESTVLKKLKPLKLVSLHKRKLTYNVAPIPPEAHYKDEFTLFERPGSKN